MIIDPKSNTPIFRQIVDQLRQAIDAGVYRAGESLPSLRALAVEIRVNPNTVQRAYEELERQGVIQSRRGLGVFVIDQESRAARDRHERAATTAIKRGVAAGMDAGVSPTRLRELFESVLNDCLSEARSQR